MQNVIEIKGLTNSFNSNLVHDALDLEVHQGEIIGIVGASGSGKSVLLNSILGLHKPDAGCIKIMGKDITRMGRKEFQEMQSLWEVLFQSGALFSSLTVCENVETPLKEHTNLSRNDRREIAAMKLALTGLSKQTHNQYPAELSGGMVKRAALARTLALDPKIVFLDEPTSGLDPIAAASFDDLISELSQNLDITVVMITHDLDSLFSICDRIAVLVDKKIKIATLEEHMKDKHPWILEYFQGKRSQSRVKKRKKETKKR